VEVIVQADVYRIEVVALQEGVVIGINVGDLERSRDALRQGFINVCDGEDLGAGDLLIVFEMLLGSLSRAD